MALNLGEGDRFPVEQLDPQPSGPAVVYFYPRDLTAGCTLQAKRFNDLYDSFRDAGYEVIGVSVDSSEKHAEFVQECGLRFPLASDMGGKLSGNIGILMPAASGDDMVSQRVTFLLDGDGTIRKIWQVERGLEFAEANPQDVLAAIGS
jgi:peroxiredoxin Q/BCP